MEEPLEHFATKLAFVTDDCDLKLSLDAREIAIVVDARSAAAYAREHIPGAIHIPHRTMREETTGKLDRTALVVTYCAGIGCNASAKGALNRARLGFQVKALIGGLAWWKRHGYKTEGPGGTDPFCGCNHARAD